MSEKIDPGRVRQEFLAALDDLDHWIWDVLLHGRRTGSLNQPGIIDVWYRHPIDGVHTCYACEEVREEHPWIIFWLERRNVSRARLIASRDEEKDDYSLLGGKALRIRSL